MTRYKTWTLTDVRGDVWLDSFGEPVAADLAERHITCSNKQFHARTPRLRLI